MLASSPTKQWQYGLLSGANSGHNVLIQRAIRGSFQLLIKEEEAALYLEVSILNSTQSTQVFAVWAIYWLESLISHSRAEANSSKSSSRTNGSSPNTTMRFSRQLPPVRTGLRVTLEVMSVVSRRFHTKAHLSHNQCVAFCNNHTSIAKTKLQT